MACTRASGRGIWYSPMLSAKVEGTPNLVSPDSRNTTPSTILEISVGYGPDRNAHAERKTPCMALVCAVSSAVSAGLSMVFSVLEAIIRVLILQDIPSY